MRLPLGQVLTADENSLLYRAFPPVNVVEANVVLVNPLVIKQHILCEVPMSAHSSTLGP